MTQVFSRYIKSFLSGAAAVAFVGCAQLSPQQVDFQPSIPTQGIITGSGTANLTVADKRADPIIGYRGGVYEETSTIVAKRPLDKVIESLALQVLEKTGIELSTAFPDMNIAISLDKLSYITEDQKASIKRTTAMAAVSIEVMKGNTTFSNGYTTSQYIDTVGYPSEEKNEVLLNSVFDSVLERMFSDTKLGAFVSN
ncbi:YajG family lipoprotein [Reinekea sp. G2M2-21]|uniref:YajG family lipoprotein n=1 Tax=Reinekea sp. G2M2-21 TaxID=2788942 RepID=UPI0018AAFB96|nr:YajG family lipoprotein [Reinekea sp. G2M2-21]